jgi:hypothetical protein
VNERFDPQGAGPHGADDTLPPFPPEQGWLDQPLPPELADVDLGAFAARTLDAVRDERQLDRDLAAVDRDLPRIVLASHEVPAPSPDFVPSVLAALHQDRRARWQEMLARHVAPEPSPEFVARTLTALRSVHGAAATATAPDRGLAALPSTTNERRADPRSGAGRRTVGMRLAGGVRRAWPLLAAAAATLLVVSLQRRDPTRPLEARLADMVPPIEAHASANSPLAFALAANERRRADTALAVASPDGVWLQLAGGR